MNEEKILVDHIVAACQDRKAKNIVTVDLSELPELSANISLYVKVIPPIQVSAISDEIVDSVKKKSKERPITMDGMREARWVGIDYGTVIVHVFIPELREFYDLEHLWADAKLEQIPDID